MNSKQRPLWRNKRHLTWILGDRRQEPAAPARSSTCTRCFRNSRRGEESLHRLDDAPQPLGVRPALTPRWRRSVRRHEARC